MKDKTDMTCECISLYMCVQVHLSAYRTTICYNTCFQTREERMLSLRVKQLSKHRLCSGDSMSNISTLCVVYHVNCSACGLELYFTR